MANQPATIDSLSKDERALVVASLMLKRGSVDRAAKQETNPDVREIRVKEMAAIEQLAARFR